VKFEECCDKKTHIKILRHVSRRSPAGGAYGPRWLNSGFEERAVSGLVVNAVYLLRCGRIHCQHVFVAGLFLYLGIQWNWYFHIPRQQGMGKFRTGSSLWKRRNERVWKKCIRALGLTSLEGYKFVLRTKEQKH